MDMHRHFPEWKLARFFFGDTRLSLIWLALRVYVGLIWISAGWQKWQDSAWTGGGAGSAVNGFLHGALAKTVGEHPDVSMWYASFIEQFALPHAVLFSYLVTYGELFVGIGLILGLFTGIAALFGMVMNFNYLFAGTASINPLLILIQLPLLLAWRVAGHLGLDRYLFKKLRR
jgi:thiosulfate dehydrogenase [quinone] large subunit